MIRKDFKLNVGNHRLLDADSSKKLLWIIDRPRENGRVERHITVTGLVAERSDFDNISMVSFAVYGTTDEDIKKIIQEIIDEIYEINPKLQPEFE